MNRSLLGIESRWHSEMKNLQFDIHRAQRDEVNIYRLKIDVKSSINLCISTNKEMDHFRGSDIHFGYQQRVDRMLNNLRGALSTIDTVLRSRNEGPFKSWPRGKALTLSPKHHRILSCGSETDGECEVLSGEIHVRLPSKSVLATKSALSKTVRSLQVEVGPNFISIERKKDGAPPLVWKYEEIERLNDIKGVYYGDKSKGNIHLNDIQRYEITVEHSSERRLQFLFYEQQEAFQWFTTLKTLHEQCTVEAVQSPRSPLCEPVPSEKIVCDGHLPQIGL